MQLSKAIEEVLLANGLSAGSNLHSWRCEYPDRYGHCTCVADLVEDILQKMKDEGYEVFGPAPEEDEVW